MTIVAAVFIKHGSSIGTVADGGRGGDRGGGKAHRGRVAPTADNPGAGRPRVARTVRLTLTPSAPTRPPC